ncbi:hypothetical protein HAX54_024780 [Datura stramonium]|uniref:Uncharacterized protein n=1 Tax=Datura stramonium TaxID=4076 RepID=A0ABS8UYC6_DATST|nr:hypothetical protein [Datura stramonium]
MVVSPEVGGLIGASTGESWGDGEMLTSAEVGGLIGASTVVEVSSLGKEGIGVSSKNILMERVGVERKKRAKEEERMINVKKWPFLQITEQGCYCNGEKKCEGNSGLYRGEHDFWH